MTRNIVMKDYEQTSKVNFFNFLKEDKKSELTESKNSGRQQEQCEGKFDRFHGIFFHVYGNLLSFLLRCGTRPYERGI